MASVFPLHQEPLAGCGEEPPPAFSHPLKEGDKKQDPVVQTTACHNSAAASQTIPLTEGVPKGRGRSFHGACDAVLSSDRGRLSGEAPEPLPLHRALYNPNLQPIARDLRKRMTKAEVCLWKYVLRAGQMKGYTFNRQRPVLRYVADFMCKPLQLIVEVDGSIHDDPKVFKHDAFRQSELEACGFIIMRFTNEEVLHSINTVRNTILTKVTVLEDRGKLKEETEAL
jgi:very-short-patch-repair endonuclease